MVTPSERFEDALTKDNLWIYILTLLEKETLYPYEIREKIKKQFGFYPGNVTAYIVIKKLESEGYIRLVRVLKESGPNRKYYKITHKGKKELEKAKEIYKRMKKFFE